MHQRKSLNFRDKSTLAHIQLNNIIKTLENKFTLEVIFSETASFSTTVIRDPVAKLVLSRKSESLLLSKART